MVERSTNTTVDQESGLFELADGGSIELTDRLNAKLYNAEDGDAVTANSAATGNANLALLNARVTSDASEAGDALISGNEPTLFPEEIDGAIAGSSTAHTSSDTTASDDAGISQQFGMASSNSSTVPDPLPGDYASPTFSEFGQIEGTQDSPNDATIQGGVESDPPLVLESSQNDGPDGNENPINPPGGGGNDDPGDPSDPPGDDGGPTDVIDDVVDTVGDVVDGVTDIVADTVSDVTEILDEVVDGVTDTIDDIVDATTDTVGDLTETVSDVVDDLTDTVDDLVSGISEPLGDTVGAVTEVVDDVVDGLTDTVGAVAETANDLIGDVTNTVDGVVDSVTDTANDLVGTTTDLVDGVVDTVGDVASALTDPVDGVSDLLDDLLGGGATDTLSGLTDGLLGSGLTDGLLGGGEEDPSQDPADTDLVVNLNPSDDGSLLDIADADINLDPAESLVGDIDINLEGDTALLSNSSGGGVVETVAELTDDIVDADVEDGDDDLESLLDLELLDLDTGAQGLTDGAVTALDVDVPDLAGSVSEGLSGLIDDSGIDGLGGLFG